jgi:hypothetical protein
MNIKRISRIMVLVLTVSAAGSVVAMAGPDNAHVVANANNGDVSRFDQAVDWTKQHWYVPAGVVIAAGLLAFKNYYDKKVAKEKVAAQKKTVRRTPVRATRTQVTRVNRRPQRVCRIVKGKRRCS